jgi:hypothetical protein
LAELLRNYPDFRSGLTRIAAVTDILLLSGAWMMFAAIVFGGLVLAVLFPPAKEKKSSAHQLGEAIEKILKETNGGDKDKKQD